MCFFLAAYKSYQPSDVPEPLWGLRPWGAAVLYHWSQIQCVMASGLVSLCTDPAQLLWLLDKPLKMSSWGASSRISHTCGDWKEWAWFCAWFKNWWGEKKKKFKNGQLMMSSWDPSPRFLLSASLQEFSHQTPPDDFILSTRVTIWHYIIKILKLWI